MSRLFEDEVVVITGGSSGIGRATAVAFAREGARVAVASRRAEESEETVRLVEAEGSEAIFIRTDVTKAAEAEALIARAEAAGGRVVKPAQKVFWGGYCGYFADPEGHIWEVAHNPFLPLDANNHISLP